MKSKIVCSAAFAIAASVAAPVASANSFFTFGTGGVTGV